MRDRGSGGDGGVEWRYGDFLGVDAFFWGGVESEGWRWVGEDRSVMFGLCYEFWRYVLAWNMMGWVVSIFVSPGWVLLVYEEVGRGAFLGGLVVALV